MQVSKMNNVLGEKQFKTKRSIEILKRLLGLVEHENKEIINNPIKYIDLARKEIQRLNQVIKDINECAFVTPSVGRSPYQFTPEPVETVHILRKDYECLQKIRSLLRTQTKKG